MCKVFVLLNTSIDESLVDAILFNSATKMLDEALIGLGMPPDAANVNNGIDLKTVQLH
jgi:hypothetical protein